MNVDEKVFNEVCAILQEYNVNFWICHGTLLGIIRDGELLPWDHDMDFAVWDSEISKEKIINIFLKNGYKEEIIFGEMDCLHFYGENKKIDISFYKVKNGLASIKWVAPPNSYMLKLYLYCIQIIWEGSDKNIELSINSFKRFSQVVLNNLLLWFKFFLPKKTMNMLYAHSIKLMNYTGYSYPVDLMKFHMIEYNNTQIQVPIDSEKCLELTYGVAWKTPKKDYVWYAEAGNLTK